MVAAPLVLLALDWTTRPGGLVEKLRALADELDGPITGVQGTGLLLSALNVKFRDIKYVVPFLIQIWMYLTVIIPFSSIPERFGTWRWL